MSLTANDELYDEAMEAVNKLFGDTSVSQDETRSRLEGLIGEIRTMIDTLKE